MLMSPVIIREVAYIAHFSSRFAKSSKNVVLMTFEPGLYMTVNTSVSPATDVDNKMFK